MLDRRGCTIKDGDTIICYFGFDDLKPVTLKAGTILNCRVGRFTHNSIIGQKYGTRITGEPNDKNNAYAYIPRMLILQNSPTLWTQAVPHRTQIIYSTDIATVIMNMRLRPGSVVAEAGTGSASLTHALGVTVAPHGHVYTFDFHRQRALDARDELGKNGLKEVVTNGWRDVCATDLSTGPVEAGTSNKQLNTLTGLEPLDAGVDAKTLAPASGFGLLARSVDAVFLDVPCPWLAIDNVVHVLKPNGILCTFSPCVEQTQRTCERLRANHLEFVDVRTVEVLTKEYEPMFSKKRRVETIPGSDATKESWVSNLQFRPQPVSKGHSAYLTFARRRLDPLPEEVPTSSAAAVSATPSDTVASE